MAAMANKSIDGFSNSPPFPEQLIAAGTGVLVSDSRIGEPTEFDPVSSSLAAFAYRYCPAYFSTLPMLSLVTKPGPDRMWRAP